MDTSPSLMRSRACRVAALALLLATAVVGAQPPDDETDPIDESGGSASRPPYLRGVDLSLPVQEAFRGWPGDDLRRRAYWLPWDFRAFRRADLFQRPVLLVLTNRWNDTARRMMRETLSDPDVLEAVNRRFVSVLVNADRRPDIAERYFTGGWPTIAFLLGNGTPMLRAGTEGQMVDPITMTYVGKEEFLFLTEEAEIYQNKWGAVLPTAGAEWARREAESRSPERGTVDDRASEQVSTWLLANADREGGGFGIAPKFPVAGLVEYGSIRDSRLLPAVGLHARKTLEKLVASPLYDRRHGGVHRIATAPDYGGIHYEKLLDRQATFLRELVIALRREENPALREALAKTAGWTASVLGRPGGGLYLAQSSDPTGPGGGRYWTADDDGGLRPPPVDRLVVSGPNALAGAALLRAGSLLGDDGAFEAGRAAIGVVLDRGYLGIGRGVRHVIEPRPDTRYHLTAQADTAFGFLDAYEATGDRRLLEAAKDIMEFAISNLKAPEGGALLDVLSEPGDVGLLRNPRRPLLPNVRVARALRRLAIHLDEPRDTDAARVILGTYAGGLGLYGVHGTEAGLAVEEVIEEPMRIRIDGDPADPRTRALRRAALASPWTWSVVVQGSTEAAEPKAALVWKGVERATTAPSAIAAIALDLGGASAGEKAP